MYRNTSSGSSAVSDSMFGRSSSRASSGQQQESRLENTSALSEREEMLEIEQAEMSAEVEESPTRIVQSKKQSISLANEDAVGGNKSSLRAVALNSSPLAETKVS